MSPDPPIYDLGSIDHEASGQDAAEAARRAIAMARAKARRPDPPPPSAPAAGVSQSVLRRELFGGGSSGGAKTLRRRAAPATSSRRDGGSAARAVQGSLSLLVPGSGQMVRGELAPGLLLLALLVLAGSFAWGWQSRLPGAVRTFETIGLPGQAALWMLPVAFLLAAAVHVTGVAAALGPWDRDDGRTPPPLVSAFASLLVPGWGQILNGARLRAALFLGGVWMVAGAWILASPWTEALLLSAGWAQGDLLRLAGSPPVRWTFPAVVWSLAVYDAAVSAAARR